MMAIVLKHGISFNEKDARCGWRLMSSLSIPKALGQNVVGRKCQKSRTPWPYGMHTLSGIVLGVKMKMKMAGIGRHTENLLLSR